MWVDVVFNRDGIGTCGLTNDDAAAAFWRPWPGDGKSVSAPEMRIPVSDDGGGCFILLWEVVGGVMAKCDDT